MTKTRKAPDVATLGSALHGMRDLHFGTRRVGFLLDALENEPGVVGMYSDGDGWNVWGEGLGETMFVTGEQNDRVTRHVVIRLDPDADFEAVVVAARNTGVLIPLGKCSYQGGEVAVLTSAFDWSEAAPGLTEVKTWFGAGS